MIERIKLIEHLLDSDLPRGEFAIAHSAWLALMGLRQNGDLDIIISSFLRKKFFSNYDSTKAFGLPGKMENRIRIFPSNHIYGSLFDVKHTDELVYKHNLTIDGVKFIEPRFYFCLKFYRNRLLKEKYARHKRLKLLFIKKYKKDISDMRLLKKFFTDGRHFDEEFNFIPLEAWGEIKEIINFRHKLFS